MKPPATACGTLELLNWLFPSCPFPPDPQQNAVPVASRAQTWKKPASIWVKLAPPATATGTQLSVLAPSPNWPLAPRPQQWASPVSVRAQVTPKPAVTVV